MAEVKQQRQQRGSWTRNYTERPSHSLLRKPLTSHGTRGQQSLPSNRRLPSSAMVYISAQDRCCFPKQPWKTWTAAARALSNRCGKNAPKWQRAEEECLEAALWAAAFAKHRGVRGQWVLAKFAQRRAWLCELQGDAAFVN